MAVSLDQRTSGYKRIKYAIAEAIRENSWTAGKAIPSETALSRRYGVSIGTIRKAIDELVSEGILLREHGRGTFVKSRTSNYMLDVFYRLEGHDGSRELPRTIWFDIRQSLPTPGIAARLNLRTDEPVFVVTKLLAKQSLPAIHDEIFMPAKLFPYFSEDLLVKYQSTVYEMFQREYGHTVVRVHETVQAIGLGEEIAGRFGLSAGVPALQIQRLALLHRDIPIETRIRHVHPGLLRYFSTLEGW